MGSRKRITLALVGLVVLVVVGWLVKENTGDSSPPSSSSPSSSGMQVKPLSQLPPEVGDTWRLIVKGGPYPYREDGQTFQNREGLLPHEKTGYYREYTVDTPGSDDRGAQRLIYGSGKELYYTADHYKSFVVVDPEH
ncbi:ribonuclease domain-containing protein [Labedaea rhizosphaerae]|uniref:Guanyl-specific ribonuclease Sa n=1 Tax=Labedaea rhizosphaerae TaxID=598644 RepID=A0A4R6S8J1_LABRH|nr:ribonuclease domain-containing protein [Labedaea rhizosphaerae]TDP96289.1 guanyl-specific ribonuclease Sa [Labedaea rhizosphaerae]